MDSHIINNGYKSETYDISLIIEAEDESSAEANKVIDHFKQISG